MVDAFVYEHLERRMIVNVVKNKLCSGTIAAS